jgi:WD40 repeat protein
MGVLAAVLALLLSTRPAPIITVHNAGQLREIMRLGPGDIYNPFRQLAWNNTGDALVATTGRTSYLWRFSHNVTDTVQLDGAGRYTTRTLFLDNSPTAFLGLAPSLLLMDIESGKRLQTLENITVASDQDWSLSADGHRIALANESSISVINTLTGERRSVIPVPDGYRFWYSRLTFNDDGTLLVAAPQDKQCSVCERPIRIWNADSGEQIMVLAALHNGIVWSFDFSSDGRILAVGGSDQTDAGDALLQLWNLNTGEESGLFAVGGRTIEQIIISPDNRRIAAQGLGDVWLWDVAELLKSGASRLHLQSDGYSLNYSAIAFSPDGQLFATGSPLGEVLLFDTNTGRLIATLQGHERRINQIAFRDDGRLLATASDDGTIRLWSLTGREVITPATESVITLPTPIFTATPTLIP